MTAWTKRDTILRAVTLVYALMFGGTLAFIIGSAFQPSASGVHYWLPLLVFLFFIQGTILYVIGTIGWSSPVHLSLRRFGFVMITLGLLVPSTLTLLLPLSLPLVGTLLATPSESDGAN